MHLPSLPNRSIHLTVLATVAKIHEIQKNGVVCGSASLSIPSNILDICSYTVDLFLHSRHHNKTSTLTNLLPLSCHRR